MPDDSTGRLLRVFGIAVTDCEDALGEQEAALRGSGAGTVSGAPLDAYERAVREVEVRWSELERLIGGCQALARAALLSGVRACGVA